jgi:hypothetical protein
MVAASSVGAAREPGADTAAVREGASFINNDAGEGATVESTEAVSPSSPGSRFRSVLQSWPVTVGAVVLIVASGASVFLLRRGAETSNARPAPTATGAAPQPVVPQTPPTLAAESLPQPSPTTPPELVQPLPVAPGTYDSFPFTPSPQDTTASGAPPTKGAAPASNVPSVVSESGAAEGNAPRGRASDAGLREKTPASAAAASRASGEDEGVDEGPSPGAPSRGSQTRTGVETRRAATQGSAPSLVNTPPPAPTPAERRKVIQWP